MTHSDLNEISLYIHGVVLLGLIAAWYKYGDRSDIIANSLAGTYALLTNLKHRISSDLLITIKKGFSPLPSNFNPVTINNGKSFNYHEYTTNFIESEKFHECISDYVENNTEYLSDYQELKSACIKWCFWVMLLSWIILSTIIFQLLSLVLHGFIDKILKISLNNWYIYITITVTGILVLFIFSIIFPKLLFSHDKIQRQRFKHDSP